MDAEQRRARRETQRRQRARQRAWGLAAVGLAFVVVLVLVVLAVAGGSSGPAPKSGVSKLVGAQRKASTSRGRTGAPAGRGGIGNQASGTVASNGSAVRRSVAVPILMYHVINPPPPGAKFPGLYVAPEEFAGQMQALARAGFHAITMDQMLAHWAHGTPLPAGKPIVLSFDNGYQSQLTQAEPVLRRLGWVGVENIQLTGLPPSQGGLSETQVKELVADGWELDTQGISHADLITLTTAALHEQVAVARAELQSRYHVPVNWFCYPSGHYNTTVIAAVKAAGYVGSTTVVPGWASPADDPYRLPRLRVLGGTSPQSLLEEIAAIRSNSPPPGSYG